MFFKLAVSNVKKSFRDYIIYFLTLAFGICVFYVFNSMDSQRAMLELTKTQDDNLLALIQVIDYVSVFISFILGFLILYANRFLMKRRKKELGIYMVLGMNKGKISRILILETLVIGVISLAIGLVAGIFLSQGLSVVTANLFETNLKEFAFVFSAPAFFKTLLYFGIIYICVMIFSTFSVSRSKLIDLIRADQKNEQLKVRKLWASVVIFILSVICLAIAYYMILKFGFFMLDWRFLVCLAFGTVGTILFFWSLSGFLLKIVQANKKLYLKNLNMFVLRQINSRVNTAFLSMSVICIMLLCTIGALSTGMSASSVYTNTLRKTTPFDASISRYTSSTDSERNDIYGRLTKDGVNFDEYASGYAQADIYVTSIYYDNLLPNDTTGSPQMVDPSTPGAGLEVNAALIKLSDWNEIMRLLGEPEVVLGPDQYLLNGTANVAVPFLEDLVKRGRTVTVGGRELHLVNDELSQIAYRTDISLNDGGTIVAPDELVTGYEMSNTLLNIQFIHDDGSSEAALTDKLTELYGDFMDAPFNRFLTRNTVYEQNIGAKAMMTFLTVYIGFVFLLTCAAVLALQQLSEASDNTRRYRLLSRLGADDKMIYRALFTQILIYFLMPLVLAVVHSYVGLTAANEAISLIGKIDVLPNLLTTAGIFIVVYGGYFLATYFSSKNIVRFRPGR